MVYAVRILKETYFIENKNQVFYLLNCLACNITVLSDGCEFASSLYIDTWLCSDYIAAYGKILAYLKSCCQHTKHTIGYICINAFNQKGWILHADPLINYNLTWGGPKCDSGCHWHCCKHFQIILKNQVCDNDGNSGTIALPPTPGCHQHRGTKLRHPESSAALLHHLRWHDDAKLRHPDNLKISIVRQWWWLPGWCRHHRTTSNGSPESSDDVIVTWQCQTNGIQSCRYLRIIIFKNFNCSAPCPKMTLRLTEVDCWFYFLLSSGTRA